jgi:hypothetical protein
VSTTADEIRGWLIEAQATEDATHMLVICDTFDHSDFPRTVTKGEDVRAVIERERSKTMQKVMEVYSLKLSLDRQLAERRAWHPEYALDEVAGARLRDEAIERVGEAAPVPFMATALDVIHRLAVERPELATDEIWEELHRIEAAEVPEPRALGAVMRQAVAKGWVVRTDRVRPSKLPQQHRRPLAVWRSKVHEVRA